MNIRYGKFFHYPRQVAKKTLAFFYPLIIKIFPLPKVMSIEETINDVLLNKKSVVRFGDSEFLFLIDKLSLPYQQYDSRLAEMFKEILVSNESKITIGLPIGYYSLESLTVESKLTWKSQIAWIYPRLKNYLDQHKIYGNASMTRLYMDYQDKSKSNQLFAMIRRIWEGRKILLIEGEKSRLGVGNDLFSNAKSVTRILGPFHNSFKQYDNLFAEAKKYSNDYLILVAMGPTAKPLAFNLAKIGFQAIDIGNLDIEYEWFLRGSIEKLKIPGKYTSEAKGGRIVGDSNDIKYNEQIIAKFINES
jgi:glycosyltransferase family protein